MLEGTKREACGTDQPASINYIIASQIFFNSSRSICFMTFFITSPKIENQEKEKKTRLFTYKTRYGIYTGSKFLNREVVVVGESHFDEWMI